MGMDLIGTGISYNWAGWKWLVDHLIDWGVDVSELRFSNDGDPISKKTCMAIAEAIEAHLHDLNPTEQDWIEPHINCWRACNVCFQY